MQAYIIIVAPVVFGPALCAETSQGLGPQRRVVPADTLSFLQLQCSAVCLTTHNDDNDITSA